MNKKILLLAAFFMVMAAAHAQTNTADKAQVEESFVYHRVVMGETVTLLAKKYKITPQDIYEYNEDAVDGISSGMSLKIPLHRQIDLSAPKLQKQPVLAPKRSDAEIADGESTPVIVAVPEAIPAEPEPVVMPEPVTEALPNAQPDAAVSNATSIEHQVKRGDTLYSLSRKYGITVDQIKADNKKVLRHGLQAGQVITIKTNTTNH